MSKANLETKFDRLLRAYDGAVEVPEASANFSADMWAAIEARRTSRFFGLAAKLVTSGALAASLLLGVLSTSPPPSIEPEYLAVYLDQTPVSDQLELPYAILEAETSAK